MEHLSRRLKRAVEAVCNVSHRSYNKGKKLKAFKDIPGPAALPGIGSTWRYILPGAQRYDPERLHEAAHLKYDEFGPLVRETLPDGSGLLSVFDPEDVKSFLQQTRAQPNRRSHLALQLYRLQRPHMYSSGGLLPSNGEEWTNLRRPSQAVFGKPDVVASHLPQVDQVVRDFMVLLRQLRAEDAHVPELLQHIKMMNLEVLLVILFGERFGCVSERPSQQCLALMEAGGLSTQAIFRTDNGPLRLYRYMTTPLYRQLARSQDFIYSVAKQKYDEAKTHRATSSPPKSSALPILQALTKTPQLGEREVIGLVCDALMAGVDTTSYSLAFALHHVSTCPPAQQKLAEEAHRLLTASHGKVTAPVMSSAKYASAALKESMRMSPISIGIGRVNASPIALRDYYIPAGTTIVSMNQHIGLNPLYFSEPERFRPERFLGERGEQQHHSHALLPFGQGSRMCIARSIARQTLQVALMHMLNEFSLTWQGPALGCKVRLINEPDGPLTLALADRRW